MTISSSLSHDDIEARELAQLRIETLGRACVPDVEERLSRTQDVEVIARLRDVLWRLDDPHRLWKEGRWEEALRLQARREGTGAVAQQAAVSNYFNKQWNRRADHIGTHWTFAKVDTIASRAAVDRLWIMAFLIEALSDELDYVIRTRAILMLTEEGTAATEYVIPALRMHSELLRTNACIILGNLKDERALPALKQTYRESTDGSDVRKFATEAILKITRKPLEDALR